MEGRGCDANEVFEKEGDCGTGIAYDEAAVVLLFDGLYRRGDLGGRAGAGAVGEAVVGDLVHGASSVSADSVARRSLHEQRSAVSDSHAPLEILASKLPSINLEVCIVGRSEAF